MQNKQPTMSPLNKLFWSLQVLPWKSNVYKCIELRIAKEKCKQIKKDGKYQHLEKKGISTILIKSQLKYVTIRINNSSWKTVTDSTGE